MTESRDTIRDVADIAEAVRRRRGEMRLRFEDVAQMAGVSRHLVSAIENGQASDQVEKLLRVLDVLQIRVEFRRGAPRHVAAPAPRQRPARTRTSPAVDPADMHAQPGRVTCLDCGASVRDLARHVKQQHGLGIAGYRQRWNIDPSTSLAPVGDDS